MASFKRILIAPGGAKGFYYLGFLLYMEHHRLLDSVEWWSGVSVGAIIGMLLSCGYTVVEIILSTIRLDLFSLLSIREQLHGPFSLNIQDTIERRGLLNIDETLGLLLNQLIFQKLNYLPSFSQLRTPFSCTSTNRTDGMTEVFGWSRNGTTPYIQTKDLTMSIVEAACLSSNLPFVFQERTYMGKKYVDGAIRDPLPVGLIDDGETEVLCIYLENIYNEENQVNQSSLSKSMRYLAELIDTPIQEIRRRSLLTISDKCTCVRIPTTNVNAIGLGISLQDKEKMVVEGYDIAFRFFRDGNV